MIIRYREINGQVVRDIVHRTRRVGEVPPVPFHENLLRTHYMLECRDGSRYRSAYPKSVTKRVLEGAMARKENL
jgi:hypothetical protein